MARWPNNTLPAAALLIALGACTFSATAAPPPTLTSIPAAALTTSSPSVAAATIAPTSIPFALEPGFANASFALPVTIRHVTEDSVSIFFELTQPASGAAAVMDGANAVAMVELDDEQIDHRVTIEGLNAATRYGLVIGLRNGQGGYQAPAYRGEAWGPVSFATAPDEAPLRVGVIGDAGMGDAVTPQLAAQMAAADPDFVVFTGDTVYRVHENSDAYEAFALKYYLPFAPILQSRPIYNTVGNHDVEAATLFEGTPFYYRAFPPFPDPRFEPSDWQGRNQWAAFAYGDVQFLLLDTQTFYNEEGGEEQIEWIKERLADPRFALTIPAFHIPPFTSGKHTYDGLGVREAWLPLFQAGNVPLVLSGHDHNYERLEANGIVYVVTGGGSASLYGLQAQLPESRFFAQASHFVILDIYPDRIEIQAIKLGGETLDTASVPLSP